MQQPNHDHYDYLFKIFLLGKFGSGKTQLINKFINNKPKAQPYFASSSQNTFSTKPNIKNIELDDKIIQLRMIEMDLLSNKTFIAFDGRIETQLKEANAFLFCFHDEQSFQTIKDNIDEIRKNNPNTRCILIRTKLDLAAEQTFTAEEIESFITNYSMTYFQTTTQEGISCNEPFEAIAQDLLQEKINQIQSQNTQKNRVNHPPTLFPKQAKQKNQKQPHDNINLPSILSGLSEFVFFPHLQLVTPYAHTNFILSIY